MKNIIYFLSLIITFSSFSQEKITDSIQGTKQNLDEVIVESVRVKYSSPITHSNILKSEL